MRCVSPKGHPARQDTKAMPKKQASEIVFKEKWVKVQIYTPTHICTGCVYCSHRRRLLHLLHGIPFTSGEFLGVSEAEISSPDGKEVTVQSVHINKANILFVREIEDGETRGLGGQGGYKPYPFVPKRSIVVKVYMPFYTLIGQAHYPKGRRIKDVLNSKLRFLALTNVGIYPSVGTTELGVGFVAVNKGQLILLEELGVTFYLPRA